MEYYWYVGIVIFCNFSEAALSVKFSKTLNVTHHVLKLYFFIQALHKILTSILEAVLKWTNIACQTKGETGYQFMNNFPSTEIISWVRQIACYL